MSGDDSLVFGSLPWRVSWFALFWRIAEHLNGGPAGPPWDSF